eukprot:GHVO01007089.1.p1 GENE.GHVO01007089.1~~GHVO01007089.1.p1  ORF type:complete len:119 (-),score=7.78 GHVO01007089.1:72-428(-)
MVKAAVFVFADTETNEGLGRVVNAMVTVRELKQAGDEVRLYFDGTGTRWPDVLSRKDHIAHQLYESVKDKVAGACLFCANAFGTKGSVQNCNVKLVDEFEQHVSVRALASGGFQIMNF